MQKDIDTRKKINADLKQAVNKTENETELKIWDADIKHEFKEDERFIQSLIAKSGDFKHQHELA